MSEPSGWGAGGELPQDALLVKEVLESMGVKQYEPRVLQQLMDFMYRYTAEILQDAEAIAERAGAPRGEVSLPDVMLAVQSRAQHAFVQPPSQQVLARIAAQHNRKPLPELRQDKYGLRLPPDVECLLQPNYQLQPRTPDAAPAQAQQAAADAAQRAAAAAAQRGAPGVKRDHRIEIRAPAALPEPGPEMEVDAGGGAGGGGDDIDLDFEDI